MKLVEDQIERFEVDNIKSNSPLFILIMTIIVTALVEIIALTDKLKIEDLVIFIIISIVVVYGCICAGIYSKNNQNLNYLEALKEFRKELKLL